MEINISKNWLDRIRDWFVNIKPELLVVLISISLAVGVDAGLYLRDVIVAYGDAESHLNIAKRVVDSLTPGFAQLGGIWLPLPHILLLPFVKFDFLWRSGLAGSLVSGAAYVISSLFIYKTAMILTKNKLASFVAAFIFITNPNILYLQATPMTELPLIAFFTLSVYYFIKFMESEKLIYLLNAALFGFCATLSRYDGWFLVGIEAGVLALLYMPIKELDIKKIINPLKWKEIFDGRKWAKFEGIIIMFSVLAFLGILLWLGWDALILGDPLYFTHSEFSAKSQQQGWLARGELPAFNNLWLSFLYYFITSMSNVGVLIWITAIVGVVAYLVKSNDARKWLVTLLLGNIFIFYIITLFMGQSVIFIPHITPPDYDWTLFNVRYGVMMVSFAAIFVGYLFNRLAVSGKLVITVLILAQFGLYGIGYSKVMSMADGVEGLSSAKRPDAETFVRNNYDGGLVLIDDFSRTVSVIRSGIPMQNIIYIGNKPYWEESLQEPEKYARWIIFQKNDTIWKTIYEPPHMQARLYAYFQKAYESPEILVFRRQ